MSAFRGHNERWLASGLLSHESTRVYELGMNGREELKDTARSDHASSVTEYAQQMAAGFVDCGADRFRVKTPFPDLLPRALPRLSERRPERGDSWAWRASEEPRGRSRLRKVNNDVSRSLVFGLGWVFHHVVRNPVYPD
jgi:hypothetical protein